MKKTIKYSFITVSVIFAIGCGGNSTGNTGTQPVVQNNNKAVSINGFTELKKDSKLDSLSQSGVNTSYDSAAKIDNNNANGLCQQGSIDINTDDSTKVLTFKADKCSDNETTIDGSASVKIEGTQESPSAVTATVTRDILLTDTKNSFSIDKGAIISIKDNKYQDADSFTLQATFKSMVNGIAFNISDFEITTVEAACGFMAPGTDCIERQTFTVKQGSFNIGENYFEIDKNQKNNIAVDELGYEDGGVIHMHDGAGHKVELHVENRLLLLKIDENGDGTFTENETLKLNEQ